MNKNYRQHVASFLKWVKAEGLLSELGAAPSAFDVVVRYFLYLNKYCRKTSTIRMHRAAVKDYFRDEVDDSPDSRMRLDYLDTELPVAGEDAVNRCVPSEEQCAYMLSNCPPVFERLLIRVQLECPQLRISEILALCANDQRVSEKTRAEIHKLISPDVSPRKYLFSKSKGGMYSRVASTKRVRDWSLLILGEPFTIDAYRLAKLRGMH
jgi:hypothetical protein